MKNQKGKLIILAILVILLAVVAFLLVKKTPETRAVSGGFNYVTSIYDMVTPLGLATDSDENIYISNTGKSEVDVYDKNGEKKFKVETSDQDGNPLQFYSPHGIAVDDNRGLVYVCDYNFRVVRVLNKAGEFQFNLPRTPDGLAGIKNYTAEFAPHGVAVTGDKVYVTSTDGVYVFDSEGTALDHWGTKGKEKGQFDFPNAIAADPSSGNLYVADTLNRRIVALTPDGTVRWMLGSPDVEGSITSPFGLPRGVAVGPDGLIYVSDTFNNQFAVVNQDGVLIALFGDRGDQDAQVNFPEGIAMTSSRQFYIADRQNNRVQIWQLPVEFQQPSISETTNFQNAFVKGDAP
jgi:DNA-binding beta-propeller fold protein YncE